MASSKQLKALIGRLDGKIKKLTTELGDAKKRKAQLSADLKKAVAEEKAKEKEKKVSMAAAAKAKKKPVAKKKPAAKKKKAA